MASYQREFLRFAIDCGVLRFGEFELKSGRLSPYFFNAGGFDSGARLARLGESYADAIVASGVGFDMLFGPAYKGIPLVAAVAIALAQRHGRDLPYAFDRKEAKDHGEGGALVGAPLRGRVLVIDDVISAGLSSDHSAGLIAAAGAQLAGIAIALDRQERGREGSESAVAQVRARHGVPVIPIATLADLRALLGEDPGRAAVVAAIDDYLARYGAARV